MSSEVACAHLPRIFNVIQNGARIHGSDIEDYGDRRRGRDRHLA